jgi:hypothetical protein
MNPCLPVSPRRSSAPPSNRARAGHVGLGLVPAALLSMLAVAGCSKDEAPPQVAKPAATAPAPAGAPPAAPAAPVEKPKGPTPVSEADLPKVPILPGYKYYVGGPMLSQDKHGRHRIRKFMDEVAQPPSRGMVFGAKQEGDKLEYKVWGNGRPLSFHRGTMRDGLYWDEYVEAYKSGKLVTRETITHDDATRTSKVVTEEFDYETGEPIRTKEMKLSYSPPVLSDDGEDEEEDEDGAPARAAPKADAPAAPAPAAPATPPAP